jgi:hypothetical protein
MSKQPALIAMFGIWVAEQMARRILFEAKALCQAAVPVPLPIAPCARSSPTPDPSNRPRGKPMSGNLSFSDSGLGSTKQANKKNTNSLMYFLISKILFSVFSAS